MNVEKDLAKAAERFFPFTLAAFETPHYTQSPSGYRDTFLANKPEGMIFYAYDVIVRSKTEITFVVYDMRCNVYGGIGEKIAEFDATVPAAVTKESIGRRVASLAAEVRQRELAAAENETVGRYGSRISRHLRELAAA